MNLSKIFNLTAIITGLFLGYVIYASLFHLLPAIGIWLIFWLLAELIYLYHLYFRCIKKGELFLLKTRVSIFNAEFLIGSILIILYIALLIPRWGKLAEFIGPHYHIYIAFLNLYGVIRYYIGQITDSPKIYSGKISFSNLFIKDLPLRWIKKASVDREKSNIILIDESQNTVTIRLKKKFFWDKLDSILKIVNDLNTTHS